jgi:hypothetical protein
LILFFFIPHILIPDNADRVHILEDRSLKIDNITMEDVGEYICEADNGVGAIVAAGMLLVHCKYIYLVYNQTSSLFSITI